MSAPARSGPHAPPRGKWYTPPAGPERRAPPGGAGRGAPPLVGTGAGRLRAPRQPGAVPVPVPVPVPRRHPARPWSCRRSVGAAPCRRATPGLLPSLRAIGLGRSGNKAAAARSRNLACPCPSPTLGRRTGGRRYGRPCAELGSRGCDLLLLLQKNASFSISIAVKPVKARFTVLPLFRLVLGLKRF